MKYTINGKEYSEFDINKRCAELLGLRIDDSQPLDCNGNFEGSVFTKIDFSKRSVGIFNYCRSKNDAWTIIENIWGDLMTYYCASKETKWQSIVARHNCSKLVAACICFIEMNE